MTDTGHYNCRDYAFTPHFSPTTYTNDHHPRYLRHESFDELEARSRSPASQKPKFPLLKLPLELRQQILSYLLPYTQTLRDAPGTYGGLGEHARNFSAVRKREAKGMPVPRGSNSSSSVGGTGSGRGSSAVVAGSTTSNNVVWRRGNIRLFSVCRQLHRECADLVYGTNTFLLFVTYAEVKFRFRWILLSGVQPTREYQFLETMPRRYMNLVKRIVVNVEHVDGYTGMVKFNVSGKGLAVGLKNRVASLVDALRFPGPPLDDDRRDGAGGANGDEMAKLDEGRSPMSRVAVRVSNGNAAIDAVRGCGFRQSEGGDVKINEDIEMILEPFGLLRNVGVCQISGAVTDDFALDLEKKMRSSEPVVLEPTKITFPDDAPGAMRRHGVQLCVYGNDI